MAACTQRRSCPLSVTCCSVDTRRLLTLFFASFVKYGDFCRSVPGATCVTCSDVSTAYEAVKRALRNQTLETTRMSMASSRATTLLLIDIVRGRGRNLVATAVPVQPAPIPNPAENRDEFPPLHARLTMVVMQASQATSSFRRTTAREATSVGRSLLAFNHIVNALRTRAHHIPLVLRSIGCTSNALKKSVAVLLEFTAVDLSVVVGTAILL